MRTLTPLCWLQSDLEDQANELRSVEENSKKACADAARLAEELRQEQDHASHIEKMRRTLESQVKELQVGDGPPHQVDTLTRPAPRGSGSWVDMSVRFSAIMSQCQLGGSGFCTVKPSYCCDAV